MALLEFNIAPSPRQLRQFGAACAVAIPLVAWLWSRSVPTTGWAAVAGAVVCGVGYVLPSALKPLFVGLSVLALPIGLIVGELALLLMFAGVFLPMALVFRIIGRDALHRRAPENGDSFWRKRSAPPESRSYYRQF